MHDQPDRERLQEHVLFGGAQVAERDRVRTVVAGEPGTVGGSEQHGRRLGPVVTRAQVTLELFEPLGVLARSHQETPRLLVVRGGRPARRLEDESQLLVLHRSARDGTRAPAVGDQRVNVLLGRRLAADLLQILYHGRSIVIQ